MSAPQQEKSRWGLIIVGLVVASGIAWFDWSSQLTDETTIVEPIERTGSQPRNDRDFVEALGKQDMATFLNPVAAVPKTTLVATLERPLFTPTRRQPPAPLPVVIAPPPPPPPPDPSELQLVGVIVANEGSVALVRMSGQRNTQSMRAGEIIGGWTIKEISARDVTVQKADVEATIAVAASRLPPIEFQTEQSAPGFYGSPDQLSPSLENNEELNGPSAGTDSER